ncbi:hypothetical protein GMA8713_00526 [Grimontia marina]|uniref:Uncharacterized protein n=1 Tax=Grimontia marina TaxID=646534 RepID=A0A128EWC8_9GAMM|nr:hypothetical protein GMA8713_00526 [Grimontia marina]
MITWLWSIFHDQPCGNNSIDKNLMEKKSGLFLKKR